MILQIGAILIHFGLGVFVVGCGATTVRDWLSCWLVGLGLACAGAILIGGA